MYDNLQASTRAAIVGVIDPDAYAAGTVTTGWIDLVKYGALLAIVMAGDMAATSTVDAKFQQAKDASGGSAKDITGAAISQLTAAGTDGDKQALINLTGADLDFNGGFRFARLSMTVTAAASDAGAIVLALGFRYGSATDNDLTSVDEIVS